MKQVVDEIRRVQPPEALVTGPDRRYRYGRARFCPADEPLAVALASETALTALEQPRSNNSVRRSTTSARPVDIAVHRPINAAMDPDNILNPGTVLTLG
jgi:hypothetical protein